jgi:hypothetical protein
MTVSQDGTARFWDVRDRIPARPDSFTKPKTSPLDERTLELA